MKEHATCVVGAGDIGGTVAAYLAAGRRRVVIVDRRGEHVKAVRRAGLRIHAPDGDARVDRLERRVRIGLTDVHPAQSVVAETT